MQITTDFNAYLIVILFFFWKNLWPFASVSFVFQSLPIASVPGPWYTCSDGWDPWPSICLCSLGLLVAERCPCFYICHLVSKGFVEEFMEAPTALDPYGRSWNCLLYSPPFDVPIFLARIFVAFCVLTQLVLLWKMWLCLPSCCCFLSCGLQPECPIFLFTVAIVLFQIRVELWTRAHCPPYFLLPGLSVRLLPAPSGDQALLLPVSPVSSL